jgi:hypothetical protein
LGNIPLLFFISSLEREREREREREEIKKKRRMEKSIIYKREERKVKG